MVYVRSRDPDGTLRGILVEDERQKNSRATILAETGRLVNGPQGPRVLLQNGSREEIDKTNGRLDVLTFAENTIDLTSDSKGEEQRYRDAGEMSLDELFHPPASTPRATSASCWSRRIAGCPARSPRRVSPWSRCWRC